MRSVFPTCSTSILTAVLLSLVGAVPAAAQAVTIDEGTFQISIEGESAGTETFSIRRSGSGSGALAIATAEITLDVPEGRLDLRPALQTSGEQMAVAAYQLKTSGHTQEEVVLQPSDGRYIIRVRSERGEREREVLAESGTILLDTNVAHQYYFVTSRFPSGGGTVPVIVPRQGTQFDLQVTEVGREEISIADSPVESRHLRLQGSGSTTDVWADDEGRILRVEGPTPGHVAVRQSLP